MKTNPGFDEVMIVNPFNPQSNNQQQIKLMRFHGPQSYFGEPPDYGYYAEPPDYGYYAEAPEYGYYGEAPDYGYYAEPPEYGYYAEPPDYGEYRAGRLFR